LAFLILGSVIYAQEQETELLPLSFETDKADLGTMIFPTYNYGTTVSWLNRIIRQTGRSNFVFRDFLPGLFFDVELGNIKLITPMFRLAAYYPLVSTFNQMPQDPNTPLHYSADVLTGAKFKLLNTSCLRVNAGPALHLLFLNSDRWNYFDLGIAAVAGIELPLASRWTLLVNGNASLDNGNLGGNRLMEPFDIVYQYQFDIGVRYSKKIENATFLFGEQKQESNNIENKPLWR
jgi:hypothetical protein